VPQHLAGNYDLRDDDRLAGQVRERDRLTISEPVPRRQGNHPPVAAHRLSRQPVSANREPQEAHVRLAGAQ
jgi:hypothetical protein